MQSYTVSDAINLINAKVKSAGMMSVLGEVSGFRGPHRGSGHCYFDIKDPSATMHCIIWASIYQSLIARGFVLKDGLKVQLEGSFSMYAPQGNLSFQVRNAQVQGEGVLRQQIAELANKLRLEGLMDSSRKRAIPAFCTRVAVVTSATGAAVQDVRRTLAKRCPLVKLYVSPCTVQGTNAPESIIVALKRAEATSPDCILLVRGGGSFEDLMTFNDESVARAVAASRVPVVTGIGHEPDTSICDMVADRRTATPTAAAESVAPSLNELASDLASSGDRLARTYLRYQDTLVSSLSNSATRMRQAIQAQLVQRQSQIEHFSKSACLLDPLEPLRARREQLLLSADRLYEALPKNLSDAQGAFAVRSSRFVDAGAHLFSGFKAHLSRQETALFALSPLAILDRGYALVQSEQGSVISDAKLPDCGDTLRIRFKEHELKAQVTEVKEGTQDTL